MSAIALKTRVLLWGRAAARCAFPGCTKELVHDATGADDESLIGDAAHIVAESDDGSRGQSPLTAEERMKYANLILMCKNHHKVIDDQYVEWTVEKLTALKKAHEADVRSRLSEPEKKRITANEAYATIVDEWMTLVDMDHWEEWSSWLLGADGPSQSVDFIKDLRATVAWLLGRVWRGDNLTLERAFHNFRLVLNDFLVLFSKYAEKHADDWYHTKRFYRIEEWNPNLYDKLLDRYERHVELVNDLVLELTRAANLICAVVRETIEPSFRLREGVLLVTSGPYSDMRFVTRRSEYREAERTEQPYPGLDGFESVRFTRDHTFSSKPPTGESPESSDA